MTIKFSASAVGFFDTKLHREIPEDAVNVSAQRHAALLEGQADGHTIIADTRGRPQLRKIEGASLANVRRARIVAIKREAERRINQRMPIWRQINALRDNTDPGFHVIDAIRQASNLIEAQLATIQTLADLAAFPVTTHPLWPIFDTAAAED